MYIFFYGSFAGFFGIAVGLFINFSLLATTTSFGVPYLTPVAPLKRSIMLDDVLTMPIWRQENRPAFLKTKEKKKEPKISMKWKKGD